MKYIKTFEMLMNPQFNIKEITDRLNVILNHNIELVGLPVDQYYDNNISSTFFVKGINPQDNKEVRINICNVEIGGKGIAFAIKKKFLIFSLQYLKHLLELYANKNDNKVDVLIKDFYDLPVKNYKDFIDELTVEGFEMWQEANKYNL